MQDQATHIAILVDMEDRNDPILNDAIPGTSENDAFEKCIQAASDSVPGNDLDEQTVRELVSEPGGWAIWVFPILQPADPWDD
jgi:hypothetical protein